MNTQKYVYDIKTDNFLLVLSKLRYNPEMTLAFTQLLLNFEAVNASVFVVCSMCRYIVVRFTKEHIQSSRDKI